MELDPIVLLAYTSVAINILTLVAAVVAYAVFRTRRHRQQSSKDAIDSPTPMPFEPVFLRPHQPAKTDSVPSSAHLGAPALTDAD